MSEPVYVIVWEYDVKPASEETFRKAYSGDGPWAALFGEAEGYLGTTLVADERRNGRYVTLDRWRSRSAFDAFQANWAAAYEALDARFEKLTTRERKIGAFETISGQSTEP